MDGLTQILRPCEDNGGPRTERGPSPGCEGEMTAPPVQPEAAPWSPDVVCNYVQRAGSVHLSFSPVNEVVDISILLQSLS